MRQWGWCEMKKKILMVGTGGTIAWIHCKYVILTVQMSRQCIGDFLQRRSKRIMDYMMDLSFVMERIRWHTQRRHYPIWFKILQSRLLLPGHKSRLIWMWQMQRRICLIVLSMRQMKDHRMWRLYLMEKWLLEQEQKKSERKVTMRFQALIFRILLWFRISVWSAIFLPFRMRKT